MNITKSIETTNYIRRLSNDKHGIISKINFADNVIEIDIETDCVKLYVYMDENRNKNINNDNVFIFKFFRNNKLVSSHHINKELVNNVYLYNRHSIVDQKEEYVKHIYKKEIDSFKKSLTNHKDIEDIIKYIRETYPNLKNEISLYIPQFLKFYEYIIENVDSIKI